MIYIYIHGINRREYTTGDCYSQAVASNGRASPLKRVEHRQSRECNVYPRETWLYETNNDRARVSQAGLRSQSNKQSYQHCEKAANTFNNTSVPQLSFPITELCLSCLSLTYIEHKPESAAIHFNIFRMDTVMGQTTIRCPITTRLAGIMKFF